MDLDKAIHSRTSVKKFKSKKPDWRDIIECIDATRYSPKAGKNFTLKFILVDDKNKIKKITEACQQDFIADASYVLVVISDHYRLKNSFGNEFGKKYGKQQAGAAIENFLLKITEKNLSTCWIGFFTEKQIKRELKIPESSNVEAIFPIGFGFGNQKKKNPIDLDNILNFNQYGNVKMKSPKGFVD